MDEITDIKIFINTYLSLIFQVGLALVILSTFFLFANLTSEFFETPKFIVLLIFICILLVFLTLKFTASGKVLFVRTPLDIPLLLLLAVGIVSTILSPSPYVALLGNQLKIHSSLVSIVIYVLFYYILVNSLKNAKTIKWVFSLTLIAAQALAVLTLLTYAGVKILPPSWVQGVNFTPTGSSFSTTAVLALLVPFMVTGILSSSKPLFLLLNSLFLLISGVTIALTGTWATWIAAVLGVILTFFAVFGFPIPVWKLKDKPGLYGLIGLICPICLIGLIAALSFIPPIGGKAQNPIYTLSQNFPREIQLDFITSWKISVSAFRDSPFWGTGPGSYTFNFTNYKPAEFNSSKVWNLKFDSPFNEYLQVLAILGGIGLIALLSLTALFLSSAYKTISEAVHLERGYTQRGEEMRLHLGGEKLALAISGLIFFVILALHSSSLVLWVLGILILASFMVINLSSENLQKNWGNKGNFNMFLRIAGFSAGEASTETIRINALPGILLTVTLALVLIVGFLGGKLALADYHHRLALNALSQNQGIIAYNELVTAEKLNPKNDVYRVDLAQINFALANAIATAKAPTEASPAGSLTDQDKQNIQILLQQSISEGKIATTLSPRSSANWEILAVLYRQIAGVATNGLTFALDAYGRAIMLDPLNPQLRVDVGGAYYAAKNYDLAIRFFTDAINLKPDFANAYYNLSVALKDKGDLTNAQAMAEKLLTLLSTSSPDYKTASDYLSDLKNKTASPAEPPAASASGALQEKELPKVINLPKPEKIATPEAIKK